MNVEIVADQVRFFDSIGLHDVDIARIEFDIDRESLEITVDDLYWNLEGVPEYPGERPCILVFSKVSEFFLDVDISDGLRITHHAIAPISLKPGHLRVEFDLSIGGGEASRGRRSIAFTFQNLAIHDRTDVP